MLNAYLVKAHTLGAIAVALIMSMSLFGLSSYAFEQKQTATDTQIKVTQIKVEWQDPQHYTDIRSADERQTVFFERVQRELEQHLQDLATRLPEGHQLDMQVVDLDLAGELLLENYNGQPQLIRVIKSNLPDSPRMKVIYRLTDAAGNTMMSDEADIRGDSLPEQKKLTRRSSSQSGFLYYEKNMLTQWFKDTFTDLGPSVEPQE